MFPLPKIAPAMMPAAKEVRAAVESALEPLKKGASGHAEQKSCFACHNQATPMLAFTTAKPRGFDISADLLKSQAEHIIGFLDTNRESFKSGREHRWSGGHRQQLAPVHARTRRPQGR